MHNMHALWSNVTKGGWKRFTDLADLQMQSVSCVDARQLHVMDDAPHTNGSLPLSSGDVHLVTTNIKWCFGGITLVAAPKIWPHLLQLGFPPPER